DPRDLRGHRPERRTGAASEIPVRFAPALLLGLLFWAAGVAAQQLALPALSGRVVDGAELLDAATEARLTGMLAAHEQATTEQVVVVTVPDLQGRSIEEFGVALGRAWGIGQRGEDNG